MGKVRIEIVIWKDEEIVSTYEEKFPENPEEMEKFVEKVKDYLIDIPDHI